MKRLALAAFAAALVGCAPKEIDLTPAAVHEGVEFSVRSEKPEYKHGEPVRIYFDIKNTGKRRVAIFIDYRKEEFGVFRSRELKGNGVEFESFGRHEVKTDQPVMVSNSSFMLLGPGELGHVYVDNIRDATPVTGKPAPLPPGKYDYTGEFAIKTGYDGKFMDKPLPFEGDGEAFLRMTPRGVWRASTTFVVTTEKATPRPERRGGNAPR